MNAVSRPRTDRRSLSDDALIRSVASSDPAALGELYDRYAAAMWSAAARTLGSRADAWDVVHAVFLKLASIAPSYDGRSSARSWLVGIAVRVALRHRRSVRRFWNMVARAPRGGQPRGADPESLASGRQELRQVADAFVKLSIRKRAVFTLVELEGLSTEEAARALDIPAATVRTRLHHARRELGLALKGGKSS